MRNFPIGNQTAGQPASRVGEAVTRPIGQIEELNNRLSIIGGNLRDLNNRLHSACERMTGDFPCRPPSGDVPGRTGLLGRLEDIADGLVVEVGTFGELVERLEKL